MKPTPRTIRLVLVIACLSAGAPARLAMSQVSTQTRTSIAIPHEEREGVAHHAEGETLIDWEAGKISIRLSITPEGDRHDTVDVYEKLRRASQVIVRGEIDRVVREILSARAIDMRRLVEENDRMFRIYDLFLSAKSEGALYREREDGTGYEASLELPFTGRGGLADFFVLAQIDIFPTGPDSRPGVGEAETSIQTVTKRISAKEGGNLAFEDGSRVVFPAGALEVDSEIRARRPAAGTQIGRAFVDWLVLEPDEVILKRPVTVSLGWDASRWREEDVVEVVSWSLKNPLENLGSETSQWASVPIQRLDRDSRTVAFEVEHFSFLAVTGRPLAYLVLDIPGKFLRKGDLLSTLTGKGTWEPGHVGLYLGANTPEDKGNDGETIIESTPEDRSLGYKKDGVQLSNLQKFKGLYGHVYLGARRPKERALGEDERQTAARKALSLLNTPYSALNGAVQLFAEGVMNADGAGEYVDLGPKGINCVELAVQAYLAAGIRLDPVLRLPGPFLPQGLFCETSPVDEVGVGVGETFRLEVQSVVYKSPSLLQSLVSTLGFKNAPYYVRQRDIPISFESTPDVSGTEDGGKWTVATAAEESSFEWTPKKKHAGKPFVLRFTAKVPWNSTTQEFSQSLKIQVKKDDGEEVDCVGTTKPQSQERKACCEKKCAGSADSRNCSYFCERMRKMAPGDAEDFRGSFGDTGGP